MASVVAFLSFVIVRYRTRLLSGIASRVLQRRKTAQSLRERVLIIGCGDAGLFAVWLLENSREASKYCVLGFIDDDIYKHKIRVRGVKVLGGRDDIPRIVEEYDIGIIIFAIHNIPSIEQKKILEICESTSAKIVIFPNVLAELDLAAVRIGELEHSKSTGTYATGKVVYQSSEISASQMDKLLEELKKDFEVGNTEEGIIRIKELQERLKI
jgi:FlaA1/EpsC-like NDP-sugar epimerase